MNSVLFWLGIIAIGMTIVAHRFYNKAELYKFKYRTEIDDHRRTEELMFQYKSAAEFYKKKYLESKSTSNNSQDITRETLEAVKYARIKSHPDNGGTMEDFVKFNEFYNKLMNNARK